MEYRNLGTAGIKVSRVCLGTAFRGQEDEGACIEVVQRALDLGLQFYRYGAVWWGTLRTSGGQGHQGTARGSGADD